MTQPVPQPVSEIQLARLGVDAELSVTAFDEGSMTFTLTRHGKSWAYSSTLGQAIQLRDFLNRHIDGLALQQTGSLALRSSDDPAQLAAVEEIPHTGIGGEQLEPVRVLGCGRRFRPLFQDNRVVCGDIYGTLRDMRHLCIRCRAR